MHDVTRKEKRKCHLLKQFALLNDDLCSELATLTFAPPVFHVYNPLEYARGAYDRYLELFATKPKKILFLGMNPGPWGMVQTGIPFGEGAAVREWLGITSGVVAPEKIHPKRPILGFSCPRSEVSGRRLWGWAKTRFGTPEVFFQEHFVANYCPLAFMEEGGRNRTPDKLKRAERVALFAACDRALRRMVGILEPEVVLGVGRFAEGRARIALEGLPVTISAIAHPSPANPRANKGWSELVSGQLRALGLL